MSKSFRYKPEEDWETQMTPKQRKLLRKQAKQIRKDRDRDFEDLEESAESDM